MSRAGGTGTLGQVTNAPSNSPDAALIAELADGVLTLTFNRPDHFNSFDDEMADAFAEQLEAAVSDEAVRVVLLTGNGPAFNAGADISLADPDAFTAATMERAARMIRAIVRLDKPVVAAVNGPAAGVGAAVAFASDIVLAAESASFLLAFARIGLMPDGGTSATVAAAVGRARAMRMALLAEPLTAADAHEAGLLAAVVPDAELMTTTAAVVRRLAAGPPLSLAATKRAVNAATLPHFEASIERETSGQLVLMRTADFAEGMKAFTEKRRPTFDGR